MNENELTRLERCEHAEKLLSEVLKCSSDDVAAMLAMVSAHGVDAMIEAVNDITDGTPLMWSFETVVLGAKYITMGKLCDTLIDDELFHKLVVIPISTHPAIYGTALEYGELDEKTLMPFSDMIKYGVTIERLTRMVKAYAEATSEHED